MHCIKYYFTPSAPDVPSEPAPQEPPISPEKPDILDGFIDVENDSWYADSVRFAINSGLMIGNGNGEWAPKKNASRAEFVQIMYNMSKASSSDFDEVKYTDVNRDSWYYDAVLWATENGLVSGFNQNTFAPNSIITREQLVSILFRYDGSNVSFDHKTVNAFKDGSNASVWALDSLAWAIEIGILNGDENGNLNPVDAVSRAEIATIIMRYLSQKNSN